MDTVVARPATVQRDQAGGKTWVGKPAVCGPKLLRALACLKSTPISDGRRVQCRCHSSVQSSLRHQRRRRRPARIPVTGRPITRRIDSDASPRDHQVGARSCPARPRSIGGRRRRTGGGADRAHEPGPARRREGKGKGLPVADVRTHHASRPPYTAPWSSNRSRCRMDTDSDLSKQEGQWRRLAGRPEPDRKDRPAASTRKEERSGWAAAGGFNGVELCSVICGLRVSHGS
jgi:hypothetical protein